MKTLFIVLLAVLLLPFTVHAQEVELATFETNYGDYGRYRGRAHNIRRTAEIIATTTLQPGERFSFNTAVGRRTRRRGFREAPVIIAGRMERGYGGGVCQSASTIYAAALHAGLTIVEHYPHSRTSAYIRPGLDATVDWGSKDLVLENPFDFPVSITTSIHPGQRPAEEILRVSITAPRRSHLVEVNIFVRRLSGFSTVVVDDPTLEPGQRRVDEPGTPRVYVSVRRTFQSLEGGTARPDERYELTYESSARRIRVGPRD